LGCSGYVYGLAMAQGLIMSGSARRVLLVTADTYSKLLHPLDRSVRTLFGDGAAATLVEATDGARPSMGPFVFGADGRGANNLIVPAGGARRPRTAETAVETQDASGNVRSLDNLYMNGAEVMAFTLGAVPTVVRQLLERSGLALEDFDLFVFHQANAFMLERLRRKLAIDAQRFVVALEHCGNTVSSTIPLALEPLMKAGAGCARRAMLVGFGVGYSWAATSIVF
jgi:3-oxoacyl-[acyl-carrier-protein] synthase-3